MGKNWINRFLERNLAVKQGTGRKIDTKRVNSSTKTEISRYFDLLKSVKEEYRVHEADIYNFDEYRINMGSPKNSKVIAGASTMVRGGTIKKISEKRGLISILETTECNNHLYHYIQMKECSNNMVPPDFSTVPGRLVLLTGPFFVHGWTSNKIGLEWCSIPFQRRVIISQSTDNRSSKVN